MDIASLADLLHETSERHGSFEAVAPPHDWWDWYAAYMDAREGGSTPDEASEQVKRFEFQRTDAHPIRSVNIRAVEIVDEVKPAAEQQGE